MSNDVLTKNNERERQVAEALASRREFTANVSHELKTPLTVIAGYAELIENGTATAKEITSFSAIIKSEAAHMLQLVEDIFVVSQLDEEEPGESSRAYEGKVALYDLACDVTERLRPFAGSHRVSLGLHCDDTTVCVRGSRDVLGKMLYNLCENAIRYNKLEGTATVCIVREQDKVRLSVADTGIGIDPQYHERVFERFYCVDKSRSRATGGTGLGLSIVKHGAQRMGATVELCSEPGEGTTITLVFHS
jgi:two-component system phosphate regulon sensor histidine kinase PhoR